MGLCYLAALQPGEVRATQWEKYDGQSLRVEQSAWRRHITTPKTEESVATQPCVAPLRELLDMFHESEGRPAEGYILKGAKGRPLNLDQFARLTIKPLLAMAGIEWHGYYACRRGLAPSQPKCCVTLKARRVCCSTRQSKRRLSTTSESATPTRYERWLSSRGCGRMNRSN